MTNTQTTLRRDGLSISPALVTIHQRMGKGDIDIPTDAMTGVRSYRAMYDAQSSEDSLALLSVGES